MEGKNSAYVGLVGRLKKNLLEDLGVGWRMMCWVFQKDTGGKRTGFM